MRIGAHVDSTDPLTEAAARSADVVQFFLSDPQGWKKPVSRQDAQRLRDSDVDIFIHAPYVINVASPNNRIRVPSRRLVVQHARAATEIGAKGLIVHGGHVTQDTDMSVGFDNWRKAFEYAESEGGFDVPILIENTAGGNHACARYLENVARLWDAIGHYSPGFCLDTCHAHAAGEDLDGIADRVKAITGRIDLVHANDSRDEAGSGRDRHTNIGSGNIPPRAIADIITAAGSPAVVETPGDGQAADIASLRELTAEGA